MRSTPRSYADISDDEDPDPFPFGLAAPGSADAGKSPSGDFSAASETRRESPPEDSNRVTRDIEAKDSERIISASYLASAPVSSPMILVSQVAHLHGESPAAVAATSRRRRDTHRASLPPWSPPRTTL